MGSMSAHTINYLKVPYDNIEGHVRSSLCPQMAVMMLLTESRSVWGKKRRGVTPVSSFVVQSITVNATVSNEIAVTAAVLTICTAPDIVMLFLRIIFEQKTSSLPNPWFGMWF
ncbi:hypothetical protein TNCV_1048531 [Trichonephila clavipes]|nr:hypothetical protein TNCV_1048531 [Trichonephila clavipes]